MALLSSSQSGGTEFRDPDSSPSGGRRGTSPEPSFWQRPIGIITLIATLVLILGAGAYLLSPWLAERGIRLFGPLVTSTYSTTTAEQKSISLNDGTKIVLGPLSELEVYKGEAEINVKGTAVITHTPKPNGTFTVMANNTITKVLGTDSAALGGTQFVIRAFDGDTATSIAVVSGRVRLGDVVILNSGNVADVAKDGKTVVTFERPMGPFTGWLNGTLEFVETPLSVVAGELRRWYNVEVLIPDTSISHDTVTATFSVDSLSPALQAISKSARVDVKISGQRITFSPGRRRRD